MSTFSLEIAQNLIESVDLFPIDFDDAWVWLDYSTKQKGQQSFDSCEMVEGIDFTVFNQKVKDDTKFGGYRTDKKLKMTVDAFKCWAMMSKTETGKTVRHYFLECEKLAKQVQAKPMSQLELLQMTVNQLVEIEQKQTALETKVELESQRTDNLEQRTDKSEQRTDNLEQLTHQHDCEIDRIFNPNGHYFSVMGYARLRGIVMPINVASSLGRKATKLCREYGYEVTKLTDPRFGLVNSYPESVLEEVFITNAIV